MEISEQLRQFGLNQSEIKVYLFLLQNGVSTPPIVSRQTFIARTNCYNILNELTSRGLVEEKLVGQRKAYLARDPESLISLVEQKREVAYRMIPGLRALYTTQKNKPRIRFCENLDEIKGLYQEILMSRLFYQVGSIESFEAALPGFKAYLEIEAQKNGATFRHIEVSDLASLLPSIESNTVSNTTHIALWDNSLAVLALSDPIYATVITNSDLSTLMKYIFEKLLVSSNA